MVYQYIAFKENGNVVKGKLSATNEETALHLLDYAGYRVVSLKVLAPLLSLGKLNARMTKIKPQDIILFYRQLALLLESGMDIISALEILRVQSASGVMKNVYTDIIAELRAGNPLSKALDKHPKIFSALCRQSLRVGEQAGGIETILRQMADYMQRELNTGKSIKSALTYPIIAAIATVIVVAILVGFVLPAFGNLYGSLGVQLPALTRNLIAVSTFVKSNFIFFGTIIGGAILGVSIYIRTVPGRLAFDRFSLKIPVLGRITHLKELSRICRSISLLFRSGLPLTEILPLVINSTGNKAIVKSLETVKEDMFKGDGLSKPMMKDPLFLPMMVQMVKVGEETGNLDVTLMAVAESYETESKDKTDALVAMIQPTMTIVIGGIIGLIALSMVSAMYSIYGQAF
ncbi:MAG: type II secretion system F family protein [Dehalococcoidales bacterium]|nr:type II secretion system F family protein [Dehalococcoidales bacterium]